MHHRFPRTSRFDGPAATPLSLSGWRGRDQPAAPGAFRAHYIADHYNNFYQAAPAEELSRYLEDIALWGINTVVVELPGPSSFSNGQRAVKPNAPQIMLLIDRTR